MKAQKEIHLIPNSLCAKINLLISDLKNLLKGIEKEYPSSINGSNFKILNNYYLVFEKNIATLYQLLDDIHNEANNFSKNATGYHSQEAYKTFSKITRQVKLIKESFYEQRQEAFAM